MKLNTADDFAQARLQKLWGVLEDFGSDGWDYTAELSGQRTMLEIRLDYRPGHRDGRVPDVGRIVTACADLMGVQVSVRLHDGGGASKLAHNRLLRFATEYA